MIYERPEALEVGAAVNVILGSKDIDEWVDSEFLRPMLLAVEEMD